MRPRRAASTVLVAALLAAGCTGDDDRGDGTSAPTSARRATPPTAPATAPDTESVHVTDACRGIGEPPGAAEITWVSRGRLMSARPGGGGERCLLEVRGATALEWGAAGDRALIGERTVVFADGPRSVGDTRERLVALSRPSGRAVVVRRADGGLHKHVFDGDGTVALPAFSGTTDEVEYHPSGTAIVAVEEPAGSPKILIASNLGENPRWLDLETALAVRNVTFAADGDVVFVAEHEMGRQHLHRLDLENGTLEVLLEVAASGGLGAVVASPFDEREIAVARGSCAGGWDDLWLSSGTGVGAIASQTWVADGTPVGWLPDGGLVVLTGGCGAAGDLYVVAAGVATFVANDVEVAAVRAVLPPPPPPPPDIELAAPA